MDTPVVAYDSQRLFVTSLFPFCKSIPFITIRACVRARSIRARGLRATAPASY